MAQAEHRTTPDLPASAPSPVVRLADLDLTRQAPGGDFEALFAPIAAPRGATRLGARLVVVPAGRKAWPFHCHHGNDEMFMILAGAGTVRFGADTFPVEAGDVVVCPAGGPETAHQLIADRGVELRYIAVSTMIEPEIMEYPDSGKVTVFAGAAPGGDKMKRRLALSLREADAVDYWDGEI